MFVGVNADPKHHYYPRTIKSLGVQAVRMLPRNNRYYTGFLRGLTALGIDVLAVTTPESFTRSQNELGLYYRGYRHLQKFYPWIGGYQIGNEPDNPAGAGQGSTPDDPGRISDQIYQARDALGPDAWIVAPGMATGLNGVDYLARLEPGALRSCNAVALHIYGTPIENVPDLIAAYQVFGLDVEITEAGMPHGYLDSEHDRAVWFSDLIAVAAAMGVHGLYVFCFTDRMHGDFGIANARGEPYEAWASIHDGALSLAA